MNPAKTIQKNPLKFADVDNILPLWMNKDRTIHVICTVLIDQSECATPGAQPEQILSESRVGLAVTTAESYGRNRSNRHSFSSINDAL